MDDLIPFFFFIVIVIANLIKAAVEKKRSSKPADENAPEAPPSKPFSLEGFFEQLAEQAAPPPRQPPVTPHLKPQPTVAFEPEEEEYWEEEEETTPAKPFQPLHAKIDEPLPEPVISMPTLKKVLQPTASRTHLTGISTSSFYMPRAGSKRSDFSIKGPKALRDAVTASLIFGPPRAFDTSFDNTIVS